TLPYVYIYILYKLCLTLKNTIKFCVHSCNTFCERNGMPSNCSCASRKPGTAGRQADGKSPPGSTQQDRPRAGCRGAGGVLPRAPRGAALPGLRKQESKWRIPRYGIRSKFGGHTPAPGS
uniref:Uncharacterized protein n=1 Tax=Anas zonorhyncha TaxID=75864 RepID=A0A8B9VQM3_9AVES